MGGTMKRWASTSEDKNMSMEAKLRQVYLKVHPDLFASFPEARKENEKSFQALSEFLEIMKGGSAVRTKVYMIKFYVKPDVEHEIQESDLRVISARLMATGGPGDVKELNKLLQLFGLGRASSSSKMEKNVFLVSDLEDFIRSYSDEAKKVIQAKQETWSNVYALQHFLHLNHQVRLSFPSGADVVTHTRVLEQISEEKILQTITSFEEKYRRLIIGNESCVHVDGRISLCCEGTPEEWLAHLTRIDWPQVARGEKLVIETRSKEKKVAESLGLRFLHASPDLEYSHTYLRLLEDMLSEASAGRSGRRRRFNQAPTVALLITESIPNFTDVEQVEGGCGIMKSKGALYATIHNGPGDIVRFVAEHASTAERYKKRLEEQRLELQEMLQQARMALGLQTLEADRSQVSVEEAILCCSKLLDLSCSPSSSTLAGVTQGIQLKIGRTYAIGADGILTLPFDLKGDEANTSSS